MEPLITIAICTRNRAAFLGKAIRSVIAQMDGDTELLIANNGSTDDTPQVVEKFIAAGERITFIHVAETGLSAARNAVMKNASGVWVLFLDDDAEAEPGWLAAYQQFLSAPPNPQVAVVGSEVIPAPEIPPPDWLRDEGKLNLGPIPFRYARGSGPWECNCAYRRADVLEIGGFDTRLGHLGSSAGYHEGVDLTTRLQDAGREIWWMPGAPIQHFIHGGRMNLKWALSSAFNSGRSRATIRLKFRPARRRTRYILIRILLFPFLFGGSLLLSLLNLLCLNSPKAARALTRASAITGLTWGLLQQLGNAIFDHV